MITFRREIVTQVVGYQDISQTRSIDDFYCQRSSVCPYVILCSIPGAGVVFGNVSLSDSLSPSQRICACGNSSCPPRNPIKIGLAHWLQIT